MTKKKSRRVVKIIDSEKYSNDEHDDKFQNMSFEERQLYIRNNWVKFIGYYRRNIDSFCVDVLGMTNLFFFQRYILRAMAKGNYSVLIACRGLTKSYISAVFFVATCILYPNIKCGIASGKGKQSRLVITAKIERELMKNPNIAREIVSIRTSPTNCSVVFSNNASIEAIVLGTSSGDSARGYRFQYLLVDEARLVDTKTIESVLIPMTKTPRQVSEKAMKNKKHEEGKVILISSAYLKTCDLYSRFTNYYDRMMSGDKDYFVCALDWKVGVDAGMFSEKSIRDAKMSPENTRDMFVYEYCGVFVGSSGESFYPYELTAPLRTLSVPELEQPKKSASDFIIMHDVAISDGRFSDNAVTIVIKLKPKIDGTYKKEVVYIKSHNGMSLPDQKEFLRELYHIKFPNAIKIVIDTKGNGQALPSLFYESWSYIDEKGNTTEFPPLVLDDDEKGAELTDAKPIIRGIMATASKNNDFYVYAKTCAENKSLRFLTQSIDVADKYKDEKSNPDEYAQYIEADRLQVEFSNIKQLMTEGGTVIYGRIEKATKRDRVTSLIYGLSVVSEMEQENRNNLYTPQYDYNDYIYVPREKLSKIKHRKSKSRY